MPAYEEPPRFTGGGPFCLSAKMYEQFGELGQFIYRGVLFILLLKSYGISRVYRVYYL